MAVQWRYVSNSHHVRFIAHSLQEEVSIPIYLFVSSDLPINGWGIFVRDEATPTEKIKGMLAEGIRIPPEYRKVDVEITDYGTPQGTPPPAYSEF